MASISVDLIDHMGSDLSVVNAARVSFDKESDWDYGELCEQCNDYHAPLLSNKDQKLIKYLADHNHWSPFSHAFASFRIKAPIFVARQLAKHQVGLAWNEVSRRYVDSEPEFYQPDTWRKRAENVKQGSGEPFMDNSYNDWLCSEAIRQSSNSYRWMLEQGVCPEQARMVLPQAMMTEWIWSGSLYAFARVCKLRLDGHTQEETRVVAWEIYKHCEDLFPHSWKVLLA